MSFGLVYVVVVFVGKERKKGIGEKSQKAKEKGMLRNISKKKMGQFHGSSEF